MQLRPRQVEFRDKCVAALAEHGNTLGVAPTGAGKTVMFSAVVGTIGGRWLVIQHRDELVAQNRKTFWMVNPSVPHDLYTAGRKRWEKRGATFGMIQTLAQNLEDIPELDGIAIDEAHHVASPSYRKVLAAAKVANSKVAIFGVTATANRGDKKGLVGIFDNVADQIPIRDLILEGHLVRPRTFVIDVGTQGALGAVKQVAGDFNMDQVAQIMDHAPLNEKIVEEWKKHAGDRRTVVFCSTIEHADHVCMAFLAGGVSAETVDGKMGERDRRAVLARFDRGEIQVIVNVAVLTEGWDCQPVSCVVLLRPSSYKSTMVQMIGRGLRKVDPERYPGIRKDDCVVLDFGTSVLMHGTIDQDVDLDQKGSKDCPECHATIPAQARDCPICGYHFPDLEAAAAASTGASPPKKRGELADFVLTEVDLLDASPYRWEDLFTNMPGVVTMADAMKSWACVIAYGGRFVALGYVKPEKDAEGAIVSPEQWRMLADSDTRILALQSADDFLREHGDSDTARKTRAWMSQPPSDKQAVLLGLPAGGMNFGITKYRAMCLLNWKFKERDVRRRVEATRQRALAA
jgi:DNA repair protein RadD